jgi:hypothetical protein
VTRRMYEPVNINDPKKPSEITQENGGVEARDTGRPTDMKDNIESQTQAAKDKMAGNNYVCCCIDPYITEEPTPYPANLLSREGDVFKHRVHFRTHVICCNMCFNAENTTQNIITRAADGAAAKGVTVDELNNVQKYFMVRSEKCDCKHHELRRLTLMGRILVHLCTLQGCFSTCKKLCCCDDCISTTNVDTIRCERTLYSRRAF